ncbi:MAG: TMEM175 family protein [Thermoplasmatota archaeon]
MSSFARRLGDRLAGELPHLPEYGVDLDDPQHYSDNSRVKNLADGTFAIAMTLLAFSLIALIPGKTVSVAGWAGLQNFFATFGEPLLVYAMTFVVLGTFWVTHAIMFHYVVRSDRPLMTRTVTLLLVVCLVPFSTQFLAQHPLDQLAIGVYAANLILCGLGLQRTFAYALQDRHLLHPVLDRRLVRAMSLTISIGPILYLLAIVVSFIQPQVAFALCFLVPIATFFPNPFWGRLFRRFVGTDEEAHRPVPRAP